MQPNFKKYCTSSIAGCIVTIFIISVVGSIKIPDFHVIAMVVSIFAIPASIIVAIVGFPVFKYVHRMLGNSSTYSAVLVSGLASGFFPLLVMSAVIGFIFGGGVKVGEFGGGVLAVFTFSIPFILSSTTIYWWWSKNA